MTLGPAIKIPSGIEGSKTTSVVPSPADPLSISLVLPGISTGVVGPQDTTEIKASKSAIAEKIFFLIIFGYLTVI